MCTCDVCEGLPDPFGIKQMDDGEIAEYITTQVDSWDAPDCYSFVARTIDKFELSELQYICKELMERLLENTPRPEKETELAEMFGEF